jgi:hypothetical protein
MIRIRGVSHPPGLAVDKEFSATRGTRLLAKASIPLETQFDV